MFNSHLRKKILIQGLIFSCLISLSIIVKSQTYAPNFERNTDETGTSKHLIARDYIKLTDGFRFTAQSGKSFHGQINPNLIFQTEYTDVQTPFSTDLPVGSLPGSVDVSPTGAATYQIPISLPPGTAGMMPNLSIVYNSQSGDGMLGRGWTIGGFSAITRVPANLYNDGVVKGIDFDAELYALDGNRLIEVETIGNSKIYRTETETFSQITRTGGGAEQSFVVRTKDGTTLT